jgi:hypothetical protein
MTDGSGRRRAWAGSCIAALAMAGALACGGGGEERRATDPASAADRQDIERMLNQFLPALASAYGSGDVESLRPYAVERVLAYTEKRINDMLGQGMVLRPRFESLVIEDIRTWGNDFAVVNTLETWDLTYYATGGESVVSDRPDSRSGWWAGGRRSSTTSRA